MNFNCTWHYYYLTFPILFLAQDQLGPFSRFYSCSIGLQELFFRSANVAGREKSLISLGEQLSELHRDAVPWRANMRQGIGLGLTPRSFKISIVDSFSKADSDGLTRTGTA